MLRYTKLTDAQVLSRLMNVIEKEKVPYTDDGLEAIIFTAQGDMRQVGVDRRRSVSVRISIAAMKLHDQKASRGGKG